MSAAGAMTLNPMTIVRTRTGLTVNGATPIVLAGTSENDNETTIAVTDSSTESPITLPDPTGTVCVSFGTC